MINWIYNLMNLLLLGPLNLLRGARRSIGRYTFDWLVINEDNKDTQMTRAPWDYSDTKNPILVHYGL